VELQRYLDEREASDLERLFELLRIPSVSALPERATAMTEAAEWLADRLRAVGVPVVEVMPTAGYPVVYGEWLVDPAKPTTILYGHYDVQPPEPLDLWLSPAFEPTIRDERVFARGVSDDKGNLLAAIDGVAAVVAVTGRPPINLKFFIEGEEEIGSPNVLGFIEEHRDLLAADFVICADGAQRGPDTPVVSVSAKGLAGMQIDVRTAGTDLHSGAYGAMVRNAAQVAATLVASLHDADGGVAVDGFYDDVAELTDEVRAEIAAVPFDDAAILRHIGAPHFSGEPGYTPAERASGRPTIDVNGIWGGFQGAGSKTVTPAEAHFKLTCRLVPDQEPNQILDLIEAHLRRACPEGVTLSRVATAGGALPFVIQRDHPALLGAKEVLADLYGRDPYIERGGGTLPIAEVFQRLIGADFVFFSFGMPDSNDHAPNENLPLDAWRRARLAHALLLGRAGDLTKADFVGF
jgi:acetylornithine deacetylase/succinyl-diaminopimelate desuccinylase-like protein